MPGKVIGRKLNYGFPGNVSRTNDNIIIARPALGAIEFGSPVVYAADGHVRAVISGDTEDMIIGVALREVKQTTDYHNSTARYEDGDTVDILTRGAVTVNFDATNGNPTAGGAVYVNVADGTYTAGAGTDTVETENMIFTTGDIGNDGVCEITVLTRKA